MPALGTEVTLWGRGPKRQPAVDRRGGAPGRHGRLRADVRARAARAGERGVRRDQPGALHFERGVRADLRRRRWLRVHAFLLGSLCFLACWAISAALMRAGVGSLALRWSVALAGGYLVFLGLLWLWCRWLLSRGEADGDLPLGDALDLIPSAAAAAASSAATAAWRPVTWPKARRGGQGRARTRRFGRRGHRRRGAAGHRGRHRGADRQRAERRGVRPVRRRGAARRGGGDRLRVGRRRARLPCAPRGLAGACHRAHLAADADAARAGGRARCGDRPLAAARPARCRRRCGCCAADGGRGEHPLHDRPGRGGVQRDPRAGRRRSERQQGVERGAPALRRARLVAARAR